MPQTTLKLIVLADEHSPRVAQVWTRIEKTIHADERIDVVGVNITGDLDCDEIDADLVVVFGGDGSMIRACRQLGRRQIPIIGVNLGRLGFLADLSPDEFVGNIQRLVERDFTVIEHLMFECIHRHADGTEDVSYGLNEVAVSSAGSLRMLDVDLAIDSEPVTTFSCDGLIISTPVGSTAHSLSAGGPILRQTLQAFVVTPICPHTLTMRPIVDSADREYVLTVPDPPEGVMMVVDGQVKRPVVDGDEIVVRRADMTFKLARVAGHSYYGTLYRKLGWGGQLNYPKQ
jgi:NAD+ kinase